MDHSVSVIGMKGDAQFKEIIDHFTSKGGDCVLLNPLYVYGEKHILSAVMHAERSWDNGTHRAKSFLSEVIMYISGERQVSKALKKMKPVSNEMVAVLFDIADPGIDEIGMVRDDSLIAGTPEKAEAMGLDTMGLDIDCEQLALELVAMLDTEKV